MLFDVFILVNALWKRTWDVITGLNDPFTNSLCGLAGMLFYSTHVSYLSVQFEYIDLLITANYLFHYLQK